jgi:hypothetical protein
MDPPTNTTKIWELMDYYNVATDAWLSNFFVFALFVCLFMILLRRSIPEAGAGAGFITSLVAFMLYSMGFIGEFVLILPFVITVISGAAMYYRSN